MAQSLEDLFYNFREAQKRDIQSEENTQQTLRDFQERIKKGESTGNVLKDYVILYCSGDAEAEEKLLGLHDSLQKHDSDIVMLRQSTISVMRVGGGCYGGDISIEHVTLSFGKISSPYLVPKFEEVSEEHKELFHLLNMEEREQLLIPVTAALTVKGEASSFGAEEQISIQSVVVDEKNSFLFNPARYLFGRERSSGENGLRNDGFPENLVGNTEVMVGEEAVKSYVVQNFYLMNQRVENELFPSKEYDFRDKERLYAKIRGLVLQPEKRQAYIDGKTEIAEKKRMQRVDALVSELMNLQTSSSKNLRAVEEQKKAKLREAVALGAHQENRVVEYRPGVQVQVGDFFRHLCDAYKVKVSENK